jgi:hypothetical protein
LRRDPSSAITCDHLDRNWGWHRHSIASDSYRFGLPFLPTRVIHVIAETPPKEKNIMISLAEAPETATALAVEEPKATPKASAAKRARTVAPKKGKSGKQATPAKKAPKSANKAAGARDGSKTATILDLLKRKDGAMLKELMKVSGWQPHSVRGFLSGTVGKKLGLAVTSTKGEDGERIYSVKA